MAEREAAPFFRQDGEGYAEFVKLVWRTCSWCGLVAPSARDNLEHQARCDEREIPQQPAPEVPTQPEPRPRPEPPFPPPPAPAAPPDWFEQPPAAGAARPGVPQR
ncbi:hypothetical protein YIM_48310 (plasmid) [Amycolatopsis sp. YIM 10]|nr:hypothetical protein YIM_13570 [Amycolatopsis sp. YIM 10]QFU94787.1 hypothetical protein YIM_48310 [Amycolatopsis sp. YIM 10]